jgi:hypothetical protein
MPTLTKATLEEVTTSGDPLVVPIQFNPTSLRLQIGNHTEGGDQPGRQARQYIGTGSATLSLELTYDTADEGTTGWPKSVLEYTSLLEHFITPRREGNQHTAPPRARFSWSEFSIEGVVESLTVELDHFAHDGTPLRAKASLSIKGQNPEYQFITIGPGANDAPSPAAPGQPRAPAAPGASNNPFSKALNGAMNNPVADALGKAQSALSQAQGKIARALSGESLAQLAQRTGLDPAAWRALANGISNPLSLGAGVAVAIGGGRIGAPQGPTRGGAQASAGASPAAQLGLDPATTPARDAGPALARGYALSAAGGIGTAVQVVKGQEAAAKAQDARRAFASSSAAARPDPAARAVDPRALSFGAGVPLRPRRRTAADERAEALNGSGRAPRGEDGLPPTTADATVPAWLALPRRQAGAPAHAKFGSGGCGCGCGGAKGGHR